MEGLPAAAGHDAAEEILLTFQAREDGLEATAPERKA